MSQELAELDDGTIIEMTLSDRGDCFSLLLERHATSVKRSIRQMVKRSSDLEDILQNTFFKAWMNLSSFRFEASFRSWLTRIALNEVFAHYRFQRSRPRDVGPGDLANLACLAESPEQLAVRSEASATIHLAIAGLPRKYREIVKLCDIEQLTAAETARHVKSTVPSVKTRRFRARLMLSAALHVRPPEDVFRKRAA
jgi:RNA polymerase sigma-70 factor, ECF subfamily